MDYRQAHTEHRLAQAREHGTLLAAAGAFMRILRAHKHELEPGELHALEFYEKAIARRRADSDVHEFVFNEAVKL